MTSRESILSLLTIIIDWGRSLVYSLLSLISLLTIIIDFVLTKLKPSWSMQTKIFTYLINEQVTITSSGKHDEWKQNIKRHQKNTKCNSMNHQRLQILTLTGVEVEFYLSGTIQCWSTGIFPLFNQHLNFPYIRYFMW